MPRLVSGVLALAAVALAGCGSSGHGSGHHTGSGAGGPEQVVAGDSDNGRTITLSTGDILIVRLHSTYWSIAAPSGGVLHLDARSTDSVPMKLHDCVPGGGCGTVDARFSAEHVGRAQVTASRTTCGEALRCVGNTGRYRLTVVVH